MRAALFAGCLLAAECAQAAGVELQIHYTAIRKILAEEVFTQEGRKYVRGDRRNKCNYAYLEQPAVGGENGELRIQARFSGRTAKGFFGRCIGLGDSFDLRITGVPYYQNGAIALRDVHVDTLGRDSFYIRRVRSALTDYMSKQFRYAVLEDARKILEARREKSPYRQELLSFHVPAIRVSSEALVLSLEFTLAVK